MSDDNLHRRADDCVSFRDMVEYVSDQEAKWHTVRAESLVFIGNALEKLEKSITDHETWHRDVLERILRDKKSNAIAIAAVIVAFLALVVTTLASLTHH